MMEGVVLSALLLGLGGSLHCLGMCGPLVLAMPFQLFKKNQQWLAIVLYNFGRVLAYVALGALAFMFGSGVNWLGLSQYLSIALGIAILLHLALPFMSKKIRVPFLNRFRIWQTKALGSVMTKKGMGWLLPAGFLNGLLPCGLVYIALAASVATNAVLPAFYFMALFGFGTIPALASLAILSHRITFGTRSKLRKLTPAISAVVAVLLVVRGLGLGIPWISPSIVHNGDKTEINCCHK